MGDEEEEEEGFDTDDEIEEMGVRNGKHSEDESAVEISSDDDSSSGVMISPPKKRKNDAEVENKAKKRKIEYKEPESDEEDFTDAGEKDDEGDSDFESEKP